MKRTSDNIPDALFSNKDKSEVLKDLLEVLRENERACSQDMKRYAWSLLVLALIFQFLLNASISQVSVVGLQLSDLSLLQKVLPVGMSFVFYCFIVTTTYKVELESLQGRIIKGIIPDFYQHDLELYYSSPSPILSDQIITSMFSGLFVKWWGNIVVFMVALVVLVGPISYIGFAIYQNSQKFGLDDWVASLSGALSAMFLFHVAFIVFCEIASS